MIHNIKRPAPPRTGPIETLNSTPSLTSDPCARNGCRLADYHGQIADDRAAEAFGAGCAYGQTVLIGGCAEAMSDGKTRIPSKAVRETLIPHQRAAEAREAARHRPAIPVASMWGDIPVRQPGESNESYAGRLRTYKRGGAR